MDCPCSVPSIVSTKNVTVSQYTDSSCNSNGGITRTVTEVPSIMTITTEITCKEPRHGKVERYDFYQNGVPPNNKSDVLILTDGMARESGEMFFQRAAMIDMWFIYISITIVYILFVISVLSGINSSWYKNLHKSNVNPYVIGILWAFATLVSYGAVFMIWEHVTANDVSIDFKLSIYFLIGAFLSLLWATIFFQGNNILVSVWIAAILFLYQFWLLIYIWTIKIRAALFMIPVVILYGYIFYTMVHLATINNIIF